ncbi:hypothetical protein Tco_0646243 [Tanacetum coccineum]
MAESSSHNPSSPEITPKEEHVTYDKPKSLNPFLPANQIEFSFDEIAFTTNNEVALLYPSDPNSEYFKEVADFISKCCLKEAFTRAPTQYKEYLCVIREDIGYSGEIRAKGTLKKSYLPPRWRLLMGQIIQCFGEKTGSMDQISNKNATILYCLENGIKLNYAKLIWKDIIHRLNKKTREKVVPYPRFISLLLEYMMPAYDNEELTINPTRVFSFHNWSLKLNQTEGPPFTDHMKAICNLDVLVDSKALKPSSQTEEVPQGKKFGAKFRPRTKAQAIIHLPHQWLVKCQQAAGGPTSLGATSKEGAHPQLSSDQTKSAREGLKTAHTDSGTNEESRADEISKKIKLEDLSDLLKDTRSAFFTPDSP